MIKDIMNANDSTTPNHREMAVLKENFPSCFRADGSFDIERFKEFLSDKIAVTGEGYELKFLGKNYARLLASIDTTTVVAPDEDHNSKPENVNSENIYISGDNLDALKHLLKSYSRRVKMIYIDPPYNTGTDGFVYNDQFNFTVEELSEKLSISEEHAERILDLTKRGSASHSAWLIFMYPRLQLARDLLTDDGVLFISIDDNEQGNLKLLCDDIYGSENFIGQIVIKSNPRGSMSDSSLAQLHEYIICYAKNKNFSAVIGHELSDDMLMEYKYEENGKKYRLLGLRQRGGFWRRSERPNLFFPIYFSEEDGSISLKKTESHRNFVLPIQPSTNEDGTWRWSKEKIKASASELIAKEITRNGDSAWDIFQKDDLNKAGTQRRTKAKSIWDEKEVNYQNGTIEIKSLLGSGVFDYVKPVYLIQRAIQMLQFNDDDIILDFFSGSATTANAVMKKNAEKESNLKFIMVQWQEEVKPASIAEKAGYKTIDQIGMERIIRAAKAIKEEFPDTTVDLGFRHFILAEPEQNTLDKLEKFDPNENKLFADKNLLVQFGKPTVLTTWLVRDGYGLTTNAEEINFAGYKGYYIGKHLYLIDPELSNKAIEAIVVKYETDSSFNPENVVLFGYSFTWTEMEALKINLKRLKDTEKNLRINFDIRY